MLLRRTLEATDRTAIVHFAPRQKTRLGALRVHGSVLMLHALLWDDEVREANFASLKEHVRISAKELEMPAALVESFASDFSPAHLSDDYQNQLRQLIDAKFKAGDAPETTAIFGEESVKNDGGVVLDFMEALRRSIEQNKPVKSTRKRAPAKAGSTKRSPTSA